MTEQRLGIKHFGALINFAQRPLCQDLIAYCKKVIDALKGKLRILRPNYT